MSQLRAATSLTRLRPASPKGREGTELFRCVYQTFTEGLDTSDLVETRAIHGEVATRVA
jgi:hypothetical protein